ncbi:MAG: 1,6-anhydro-N-acetylmuramyl-L-alanine amidase AmpD [Bacterioplanes sp.]|nr:1,6-anhydro-N-acetylmuramyl-L-alanine amidase AmpD [Bacterioplanes sp.]
MIIDGRLADALWHPSPNFNARPEGCEPNLIVIHNISLPPRQFGTPYVTDFFLNKLDPNAHEYFASIAHLQVSSHVLIDRTGTVHQYVRFDDRAWHAGASRYRGQENCNDFAIGIELEGCDDVPYRDAQYQQLVNVIRQLQTTYPAIGNRITGHEHIAPQRKTDPGAAFDWRLLEHHLQQTLAIDAEHLGDLS